MCRVHSFSNKLNALNFYELDKLKTSVLMWDEDKISRKNLIDIAAEIKWDGNRSLMISDGVWRRGKCRKKLFTTKKVNLGLGHGQKL